MIKRVGKRGDTLIEVTLAVGIFSMIAIAITAVMSSGTSGAQASLETTLTREEIDTQAEALRFIQTAYAVDRDAADKRFPNLWDQIKTHAIKIGDINEENQPGILQYSPDSCKELYSNPRIADAAFVINPRKLGTFTSDTSNKSTGVKSVYISRKEQSSKFANATTYPRLIFGINKNNNEGLDNSMISGTTYDALFHAEGIYVIAVKDADTTHLINTTGNKSAYYDFYIRTCWYGTDANEPSTISTVIRLYDPDAI
ncbi:hypothetical protein IKF21_01535 [Candidatus Saccharibacteria bacterium]|nr:hypothetical protein [Candidatus Saccharibacteria bacterium]